MTPDVDGPSPRHRLPSGTRVGVGGTAVALAGAMVLAVASLIEPRRLLAVGEGSRLWLGVGVDRLAAVLLVLIAGVSLVVQVHAARSLRHEDRQGPFGWWALTLTGASMLVAAAASPLALALGWLLGGVAVVRLVGLGGAAPARLVRRHLAWGDAAMAGAVTLLVVAVGPVDLQRPGDLAAHAGRTWVLALVAAALVVAVASRSAQHPFADWLPATVAAPTPVSALLHAGVVNAGAIVLLRLGAVIDPFPVLWTVLVLAAGLTMATSVLASVVTPDTKGVLVRSTAAQTGFLLLAAAAGAPVAAVAHLVGHAAYKSSAFLGSGGTVAAGQRGVVDGVPPTVAPARRAVLGAAAVAVPVVVVAASVELLPGHHLSAVLALFGVATAAAALLGWFRHRPDTAGAVAGTAVVAVLIPAYLTLLAGLEAYLEPAVAGPAAIAGLGWSALAVAALAAALPALALAAARRRPSTPLEATVFRRALAWSRPPLVADPRPGTMTTGWLR